MADYTRLMMTCKQLYSKRGLDWIVCAKDVMKAVQGQLNTDMTRWLIDSPHYTLEFQQHALPQACKYGSLSLVEFVLSKHIGDLHESVLACCRRGHPEILRRLLQDERADPKRDRNIAFKLCCSTGKASCVQVFLDDGRVNPLMPDFQPMNLAVLHNHLQVIQVLFSSPEAMPGLDVAKEVAQELSRSEILAYLSTIS
ncbi:hypothetical protein EDD86DRAFT_244405 [Gorgonomyces haynaldii]|nr:hypothetical protein EDD86DRAFT_244405 [Gorgonomyces haynaldii]